MPTAPRRPDDIVPERPKLPEWLTVEQAALVYGRHPRTIQRCIAARKIEAAQMGHRYFVRNTHHAAGRFGH
jgi:excisionase family DNA binding protein